MTQKKNEQNPKEEEGDHVREKEESQSSQEDDQEESKKSPREQKPNNSGNESTQEDEESDIEFLGPAMYQEAETTPSVELKQSDSKKKNKALLELRCRVEDAIVGNYLLGKPNKRISPAESARQREELREISLWGVPLLPSKGHQGTDIVLLKFLRAKDFKVLDAFKMLRRTLKWRKEYRTDEILEEELGSDLENLVFWSSVDKEGHPLCFTVYGPFKERELYKRTFGSKEKRQQFLRWRIQFMEKGVKKLNFKNGGVDSMVHVTDLKNSPGRI